MQINSFAEVVAGWVQGFGKSLHFVRRRRADGEYFGVLQAPKGSRAGALAISTSRGNLWVRLLKADAMCPVDSRQELGRFVRALVSERAVFATTYRNGAWRGVSLLPRRGPLPIPRRNEVVKVVSWSGRFDQTIAADKPTRAVRKPRCGAA